MSKTRGCYQNTLATTSPSHSLLFSPFGRKNLQLSAHATRASRRANVRRDSNSSKLPHSLRDGVANRHALRTRAHGIRRILDIDARDDDGRRAVRCRRQRQQRGAHAEPAVGAVGLVLGGDGGGAEGAELGRRQLVGLAG